MSVSSAIAAAGYLATLESVELLAHEHVVSTETLKDTTGTYLGVLIAATQKRVWEGRRRKLGAIEALNSVHESYYAAVLKGVTELDTDSKEAHRRATFARTAKSTLLKYLEAGKSLDALKPGETSKRFLRDAIAPVEVADRNKRTIMRATGMLLRAVKKEAKADRIAAMRDLGNVLISIEEELHVLEAIKEDSTKVVRHRLTRTESADVPLGTQ